MPRINARVAAPSHDAAFSDYYRFAEQRSENAALIATDRARTIALNDIRDAMKNAGLGRLGNGLGSNSDLAEGRGVHRSSGGGFSASGVVFIRSRSPRTRGAIQAYTEGAEIRPVRGRWLWIATDDIPRVTGRERMTPALYRQNGFEQKIGPLVFVRSVNGNPLLVVKNAGVSEVGKSRSARSLTKRGQARKGQRIKEFLVAFIGIPRTARAARVDASAIMSRVQAQLPDLYAQAMGRI